MGRVRVLIVLVSILLSGCWSYGSGSKVDACDIADAEGKYVTWEQVAQLYEVTMACVGVTADPPTVTFEDLTLIGIANPGLYLRTSVEVIVNTGVPNRDCESDAWVLRHEFVHHLLDASGLLWEDNKNHQSELFGICNVN